MTVRDFKLSMICGAETDEIKLINKFFDDLFTDIEIYKYDNNRSKK